jgi:hypothetical protein
MDRTEESLCTAKLALDLLYWGAEERTMGAQSSFVVKSVFAIASALTTALVIGCGAAPDGTSEETGSEESAVFVGTCGAGGTRAWNLSDPFESQMAAFGCTKPVAYDTSTGGFMMDTECPSSAALNSLIKTYSTVAPYDTTTSTVYVNAGCYVYPPAWYVGKTIVDFDPNCSTCRTLN